MTRLRLSAIPSGSGVSGLYVLVSLIAACTLVETVLQLSDWRVLADARLRGTALAYGAFWPGLMGDWAANYPAQPYAMYLTYAFLHGGLLHLGLNMITLWSLGLAALERLGPARFALLYLGAAIGGGAVYALLDVSGRPMVGASGALFGLAGAILAWVWEDQPTIRASIRAVSRAVLILLAINIVLHIALSGQLAWQTHLGGFLAGWVLAIALDPPYGSSEAS